jgi:methylmalonyl-CoA mutase C-terminal domain/subunit
MSTPVRVLVAKPGLDGHERGAKLVARALRDAGFEVIYTGIRQKPAVIASIAVQEDVDVVGLSVLSGAHLGLTRKTLEALRLSGADHVKVVVGGTVPPGDVQTLLDMGVSGVFPTGTPIETLVKEVRRISAAQLGESGEMSTAPADES